MYWKHKSRIQNAVALLPSKASYGAYFWLQRYFGGLRHPNPTNGLASAIAACQLLQDSGQSSTNKVFFEIGTGRAPVVPIAYWLMGAKCTITVDINPYLRSDITRESLGFINANNERIREMFGPLIDDSRFNELLEFYRNGPFSLSKLLDLCCIQYIAPGDATSTGLPAQHVDVHTSFRVLEHVPPEDLSMILEEGNRILKDNGQFIHRIDYSDHFAHSDPSISKINFLQFAEKEWAKYAGNRYMYMNRLRHDDYLMLFENAGQQLLIEKPDLDRRCLSLLRNNQLQVDPRFLDKSPEVLATTGAWIVSARKGWNRHRQGPGQ